MSNENQKARPKFKISVIEIILLVVLGLMFVLTFIDNIVWGLGFASYMGIIMQTAVLLCLGAFHILAIKKNNTKMAVTTSVFLLFANHIYFPTMTLDAGFAEFSGVFGNIFFIALLFMMALVLLSFLMDNKFTNKTPRIMEYILSPLFIVYALFYFIYTLIYGFRNYDPMPTMALITVARLFLVVFFALIFTYSLIPLLATYMKKAAPKKKEAEVVEEKETPKEELKEETKEDETPNE
ncbi:MAG: hypothetical protein WC275_04560 [Bacilli bacterium]